ncbi:MAG: cyclic nucleotide-binding domain-containing protein [Bdellovibrio sp.]|nr:cyclic nucleotide-binding domain-containing protein [Bdellovibrio sp.]
MRLEQLLEYGPYITVLSSLLINRRHLRHTLALIGAVWAFIALNSSSPLILSSLWNAPLSVFWIGMISIHSLLLLYSGWLRIMPLPEHHRIIYHRFFKKFSRPNFKKLMEISTIENKAHGAPLTKQGEPMNFVMCMLDGSAGVIIDGHKIASLHNGDFIGEISFLSGNRSLASR